MKPAEKLVCIGYRSECFFVFSLKEESTISFPSRPNVLHMGSFV